MDWHENRYWQLFLNNLQVCKISVWSNYVFASYSDFFVCAKRISRKKKQKQDSLLTYILWKAYVISFNLICILPS